MSVDEFDLVLSAVLKFVGGEIRAHHSPTVADEHIFFPNHYPSLKTLDKVAQYLQDKHEVAATVGVRMNADGQQQSCIILHEPLPADLGSQPV